MGSISSSPSAGSRMPVSITSRRIPGLKLEASPARSSNGPTSAPVPSRRWYSPRAPLFSVSSFASAHAICVSRISTVQMAGSWAATGGAWAAAAQASAVRQWAQVRMKRGGRCSIGLKLPHRRCWFTPGQPRVTLFPIAELSTDSFEACVAPRHADVPA